MTEKGENRLIARLFEALGLGSLTAEPVPVSGGLMHRMYRVEAVSGTYAVKYLDPEIMRRPAALGNMAAGERIAEAFREIVEAVPALRVKTKQVQELDGAYFTVYAWVGGKSVFCPEIGPAHCAAVGDALGRIHSAAIRVEGVEPETEGTEPIEWPLPGSGTDEAGDGTPWLRRYLDAVPTLAEWDRQVRQAMPVLEAEQVISHRDLDPKNVLWDGLTPRIIDWEAAGYVNPWQEIVEAVGYWAVDPGGALDVPCAESLLIAYAKYRDLRDLPWEAVSVGARSGMLGWLAWQAGRALRADPGTEERQDAVRQVTGTLDALDGYQKRLELLRGLLRTATAG